MALAKMNAQDCFDIDLATFEDELNQAKVMLQFTKEIYVTLLHSGDNKDYAIVDFIKRCGISDEEIKEFTISATYDKAMKHAEKTLNEFARKEFLLEKQYKLKLKTEISMIGCDVLVFMCKQ